LLETVGLIVPVGEWVIEQPARDCRQWMRAGLPPVRVAVNIAPGQLRHADFESGFMKAITPRANLDWGLDIEITEGVEKQQELDLLWQLGCDQSQGFLHSPAAASN
jgi:diguanylate cyclase